MTEYRTRDFECARCNGPVTGPAKIAHGRVYHSVCEPVTHYYLVKRREVTYALVQAIDSADANGLAKALPATAFLEYSGETSGHVWVDSTVDPDDPGLKQAIREARERSEKPRARGDAVHCGCGLPRCEVDHPSSEKGADPK